MKKSLLFIIICGIVLIVSSLIAQAEVITIPDPLGEGTTIPDIIKAIMNKVLLPIGGGLAVIMIIWAGILYMTAGGSEEKIRAAKKTIMWTVIGFAILISAKFIIDAIDYLLKSSGIE